MGPANPGVATAPCWAQRQVHVPGALAKAGIPKAPGIPEAIGLPPKGTVGTIGVTVPGAGAAPGMGEIPGIVPASGDPGSFATRTGAPDGRPSTRRVRA